MAIKHLFMGSVELKSEQIISTSGRVSTSAHASMLASYVGDSSGVFLLAATKNATVERTAIEHRRKSISS